MILSFHLGGRVNVSKGDDGDVSVAGLSNRLKVYADLVDGYQIS